MKSDGLVTVLGEACVNQKAAESTGHLITFPYQYYALFVKLAELPVRNWSMYVLITQVHNALYLDFYLYRPIKTKQNQIIISHLLPALKWKSKYQMIRGQKLNSIYDYIYCRND